jgi:hypothetical protein
MSSACNSKARGSNNWILNLNDGVDPSASRYQSLAKRTYLPMYLCMYSCAVSFDSTCELRENSEYSCVPEKLFTN